MRSYEENSLVAKSWAFASAPGTQGHEEDQLSVLKRSTENMTGYLAPKEQGGCTSPQGCLCKGEIGRNRILGVAPSREDFPANLCVGTGVGSSGGITVSEQPHLHGS